MPRIPTLQVPNVQNASNNTIVSSVQNGDLVRADALNNSLENVRKVLHHGMGLVNQYQQMRTDSEDILASAELKKLQASKFGEFQQKMAENPFEYEKFEEWRNEYENSFAEEALPIYSKMSDQRRKIMQEEMELQKEDRKNNVLNMMIQADATAKRERFISLYEDGVKRQDGIFLKELIKNCRGKIISDQEADNRLGEIERFSQWYEAKDQIASGAMDITSKLEERSESGAYKNFTQLSESDRSKLISYSRQVQAENIYNSNEEFRSKILTGEVITEEEINKDFESGKINRAQFNDRLEVVKKLNALRQEKELQSQKELEKAELQKKREAASAAAEKFEHDVDAFDLRLLMFEFDPIKEKRMEQRNALQEEILKKYQAEHPDVAARLYKQLNSSFKAADERLTDTNNKASSMRELKNQPNYVYAMQQMKSMINDGQFGYKEKGWLWSSTEEDKSGTIASILPLKIDEFMQNNPDATQEQINNFLQDLKKQVNQTYFKDILSTWGNLNNTNYVKKKFNDNEILRQTRDGRIAVYNSENQFVRYEDESSSSPDEVPAFEDTTSVDSFNISISRDTLKKMFSDDPLAFIEDEQEKASIDYTLIGDGLADENRKKLALSVFYGMMGKINPGYIYDNIEDFIAKYNGGNPQSIKEAYAEVAKMINPNTRHKTMGAIEGMEWNRDNWKVDISNMQPSNAEIALESGIANTMTTAANIGNRLLELGIWASGQTPISGQILAGDGLNKVGKENLERQLGEKATVKQRSKDETFALLEEIKKNNTSYWQDIDEKNWEKLNVPDDWVTNSKSVSNFARNAFYSFLREAPNMTFQGAAMLANPMIGTTMIGVTSANDKDYYLRYNYPDMSPSIRITNAVFTGVINGSLERITAGILRGKNFPIDKFSLKSGFVEAAKYYAKSFGKESLEEGTEQLLENTVDVLSGVHGPMRNLTVKETFQDLLQGVPESMAIGGLYGLPFAAVGHKSARDLDRARMGIIAEAEQKRTELLDLKELTPEEKVDLETLDSIIDSADSMEVFDQYQKYAAKKIYKDAMTEYSENDMDINEIASKAEDRIHLRNDIRHDIKQTENSFLHFAASFPKVNMIFYPTRADVPPEVCSELENMNRPIELAKAFVYDGKVCMIGENVRPSQVIRVGAHEVIGHLGLKSVFGDKFDSFLDIVAKQHSSEIEESAKLYNQDIGTVEGVRYATEEFLAKTAESKAELKPHWWNGFLSWIKQQLRQLPMFKNLRVTDREIESAFMRSFKATSKGRTTSELLNNTQEKAATDNNGSYDPNNQDIRYSLADYSEADRFDLIKAIKPYVGRSMNKSDADYLKFFKDKNLPVYTEADAHEIAATAMYENRSDSRRAAAQKRDKWLYDNLPLYAAAVDYSGPDFKIKVGDRYKGLEITGTFLSEKEGIPSDLLAESIAKKTGGEPLIIEDEIIDFYNDLTKPKLRNMFVKAKEEEITSNRELDRQMKDAYRLEEKQRIDDDVMTILELGNPVNQELFDNDPKVGKRLLAVFFGRRDLRNGDLEAINEALQSDKDAKTYATAFRNAKKAVERDYQNKLKEIQNTVNKKEVDTESLEKQAFDFANEHVDQSYRSEFLQRILELPNYSILPTRNNPYGRRNMEFQKILEDIIIKGSNDKINDLIDDMKQMTHAAKIKRTAKGIPYSVLPGEQATVNRIADILNWDLPAVAAAINDNMTRQQAENSNYEELLKDLDLLNKFGGLKAKSLTEVRRAYKTLQDIIRGGKYQYNRKLTEKRDLLKNLQYRQIQELNVLNVDLKKDGGKFNKIIEDGLSKNLNIGTSFHLLSIGHDFDKSVSGILYREIEKSTYTEVTKNRKNQERLDDFLKNELGIKTIKQKADFYKRLHEVKESGVHIRVYSSFVQKGGKNQLIKVNGKRIPISIEIPVEDARNLLELRKQGNNVNNYKGNALDGFSLDFLEKQLADFDAGLKYAYDLFGDSAENEAYLDLNENINSELEKDRANKHLRLYFHDPNETWETTELKLSPGAALQILLTWEQKDMRSAMEFNGWTENSIKELKKFIPDDILKLGYQMRSWLEENSAELDRAVFSKYGAHLPGIENYYPTSFRESLKRSADTGSLAYGMGTMSMNPSFLIARKFHLKPVDTEVDAVSMFIRNQIETSHFISWYNTIDLLRGVYGDRYVQAAISNKFGNVLSRKIIDEIKALARGGGDIANGARILQSFYKNWIPSKIILNNSSLLKQIAGVVSYANEIPIKDFFSGLAAANNLNSEYKKWRDEVLKSDYLKNRISGGLDKDLIYLMNPQQSGVSSFSVLADRIFKAAAKPTVYCDLLSVLHGGYSVYLYHKKQAMRAGASEEDAHKRAIMYWQRLTDETQQSAYLKDQNFFQMNQSIWRYFTAFASNPIQVMNLQLRTMAEMRYGDGVTKARAKEKLKRQIVINHILTPILMVGISDMLRNGFDFEEYELEDYMIAMLLGNFNTFVIAGQLANFGLNQVGGIFRNGKVSKNFGGSVYPAIPLVDDASKDLTAVNAIIATIAKNEEYTAEDAANLIQLFGDSTMLVGAFKPNVGRAGAFISAIGNQWERLIKLTKEKK